MKKHNKFIAGVMALCLAFGVGVIPESIAPFVSMTASAEEDYTYENLKYKFLEDGTIEIKSCDKSATEVVIPAEIDGVPVTSIGVYAFQSPDLISVTLPNTIKYIQAHAFDGTGLTEITIPENVVYIGISAFDMYNCLEKMIILNPKVEIDSMVQVISHGMMIYGYENSTAQEYTEKYNQIFNDNVFPFISLGKAPTQTVSSGTYGENLTWKLENEVLTISGKGDMENYSLGDSPLYKLENIKKVIIEDGITSISDNAFYRYNDLTSVTIPDSVTSIGNKAFYNCKNLTEITIPESVTNIEEFAFLYCRKLAEITIPKSVNSIGYNSFLGCTVLEKITILNPDCEIDSSGYTIDDTVTIYGYENSTAQAYAEKYNRKFESLGKAPEKTGDINSDGKFKISDVVMLQKYILGDSDLEIPDWKQADFTGDGVLDSFDLVMMRKKLIEELL